MSFLYMFSVMADCDGRGIMLPIIHNVYKLKCGSHAWDHTYTTPTVGSLLMLLFFAAAQPAQSALLGLRAVSRQ